MEKEKQVYNRVYTKEKWDKVNKYNKQLLDDYILQIKSESKSEGSIKQYYNDARIIMIYVMESCKNKEFYKLKSKSFRNFKLWCQENGMSPARTNRLLVTSRNLLNFGMEDEEFEEDFEECKINTNRLKGLRNEKTRDIIFLTDEEVDIIYTNLIKQKKYSQALLCALMYDSAGRKNEMYQVKRSDLSVDGKICESYVVGKRGKKYKPIYHRKTRYAYKKLTENLPQEVDSIWLTRNNTKVSYQMLYSWIVSWRYLLEKEIGEHKLFGPHSFRHSALENYNNGTHYAIREQNKKLSLETLQILANHSSIDTTKSYLRDKSEDILLEEFGII